MDLDDMLDDIDIDAIEPQCVGDDILNAAADNVFANDVGKDDIGEDLEQQMEAAELASWTNAVSSISPAVREKWTDFVKDDNKTINNSKMQTSYAYKQWNGEGGDLTKPMSLNPGVSKILHELVRSSGAKATGIEEAKIAKLVALCDPLKGDTGKRLNREFAEQIVRDNREIIAGDSNYEPQKFQKVAHYIAAL